MSNLVSVGIGEDLLDPLLDVLLLALGSTVKLRVAHG